MTDPYLAMAMLTLAALVIGAVIFGGTTLAFVLEQRGAGLPQPKAEDLPHEPGRIAVTAVRPEIRHHRAA